MLRCMQTASGDAVQFTLCASPVYLRAFICFYMKEVIEHANQT